MDMARQTLANISPGQQRAAAPDSAVKKSTGSVSRPPLAEVQSIFHNNINKTAHNVVLHVDGLDDFHCRRMVEQKLLDTKGVVSFTFDMKASRVSIRTRDWVKIEVRCVWVGP